MRIVRFQQARNTGYGFIIDDRVVPAESVKGLAAVSLMDFIASGRRVDAGELAVRLGIPLSEVALLPPVVPEKVLCVGVNYVTHRKEAALASERPSFPTIFIRFPDSYVGDREDITLPSVSSSFDYEGELAVVIGKPTWRVTEDEAEEAIYGYSCFNDCTVRDWQRHSTQWTSGKNFFRSGSFGPAIVTKDELTGLSSRGLVTKVNGVTRQSAILGDMLFSVPQIVSYISQFTPLKPGDVIATGTPGGVGAFMEPPTFLDEGDRLEVAIDGLGSLTNRVVSESQTELRMQMAAPGV
jgi:2-keto-4-pentenoate hydratase/2-oxohepta-3-ene-1,7-dioic acid hydratase in catechol pathway